MEREHGVLGFFYNWDDTAFSLSVKVLVNSLICERNKSQAMLCMNMNTI